LFQERAMMSNAFRLVGIPYEPFAGLFDLSDEELAQRGAVRCIAPESSALPCRVSLEHARPGEELLLLPYEHQPANSPYRASGPIYVRRSAVRRSLPAGVVPPYVTTRVMSVRAYDAAHMIVDATVCEGEAAAEAMQEYFSRPEVAYLHLHNAKRGCFSCQVLRA
jgi:Protein of unknown function (DUF1203)